ncbi:hypothetical protein GCM10022284_08450 [Streptomyces hundungensis]
MTSMTAPMAAAAIRAAGRRRFIRGLRESEFWARAFLRTFFLTAFFRSAFFRVLPVHVLPELGAPGGVRAVNRMIATELRHSRGWNKPPGSLMRAPDPSRSRVIPRTYAPTLLSDALYAAVRPA